MVETEQPAQANPSLHVGVRAEWWRGSLQESVAESLMIPLAVVVRNVLADEAA